MLPVLPQKSMGFAWQTVGEFQTLGLSSALVAWFVMALTHAAGSPHRCWASH